MEETSTPFPALTHPHGDELFAAVNEQEEVVVEKFEEVEEEDFLPNFPPGYRFAPLDEELITHYLLRKIKDQALPPNKIKDVNIYKYNPEDLAQKYKVYGEDEKEWYFFTPRDKKYPNGSRPNRAAGDGFWKATGADKKIERDGKAIGLRKALVFYRGKAPKGEKTNWIMHEYRTPDKQNPRLRAAGLHNMQLDKWVLCRIYEKNDKSPKAYTYGKTRSPQEALEQDEHLDLCDDVPYQGWPYEGETNCIVDGLGESHNLLSSHGSYPLPLNHNFRVVDYPNYLFMNEGRTPQSQYYENHHNPYPPFHQPIQSTQLHYLQTPLDAKIIEPIYPNYLCDDNDLFNCWVSNEMSQAAFGEVSSHHVLPTNVSKAV